jgi:hypothetical protein
MYRRGAIYNKDKEGCEKTSKFCDIFVTKKFNISDALRHIIINTIKENNTGTRVDTIGWKRGRTLTCQEIAAKLPEVIDFYKSLTSTITNLIGTDVTITSLDNPTSCSILVYEKKGDFINWHYDVNYYNGRFFTLIIPITFDKTCTNFKYKYNGNDITVPHDKSILFEGAKLFHMATPMCDGNFRAVLSLQFVTSTKINITNKAFLQIKDNFAYSGLSRKDMFLWLLRVVYLTIYLSFCMYVLVYVTKKYDVIYMCLFAIMLLNWILFKGECLFGFIEKRIIDPSYVMGSQLLQLLSYFYYVFQNLYILKISKYINFR